MTPQRSRCDAMTKSVVAAIGRKLLAELGSVAAK
jgi:hypothetical protein